MFTRDIEGEEIWRQERRSTRDFRRARFRARSRRISHRVRRWMSGDPACCEDCCEALACFGKSVAGLRKDAAVEKSFETVEIEKIAGSVGRCRAFDDAFLPTCACSRDKWERVDRAFRESKPLPPVELYKVGDEYFVYDGNHRVSVARHHNAAAIDALVTEFIAP